MPTQVELLQEAYKRGILPEEKRPLYDEAVRRGLIPGGAPQQPASPASEPLPLYTPEVENQLQARDAAESRQRQARPPQAQVPQPAPQGAPASGFGNFVNSVLSAPEPLTNLAFRAAEGLGIISPEQMQGYVNYRPLPNDPTRVSGMIGAGVGQIPVALTGPAAPALFAASGMEQATQTIEQAAQQGQTASTAGNIANVVGEGVLNYALGKLAPGQRANDAILKSMLPELKSVAGNLALRSGAGAATGVAENVAQAGLSNALARLTGVDPNRDLTEGFGAAAIQGGVFGGAGQLATDSLGGARSQPDAPAVAPEVALRPRQEQSIDFPDAEFLTPEQAGAPKIDPNYIGELRRKADTIPDYVDPLQRGRRQFDPITGKQAKALKDNAEFLSPEEAGAFPTEFDNADGVAKYAAQFDPDVKSGDMPADATASYFKGELSKVEGGGGKFVLKDVPVNQFDLNPDYQPDVVKQYAAGRADTSPPPVGGVVNGRLVAVDGNTRVRAAIARGDTTVRTYVPESYNPKDAIPVGEFLSPDQVKLPPVPPITELSKPKLIAWAKANGYRTTDIGPRGKSSIHQQLQAQFDAANERQLPADAKTWDAGRLRKFAEENGIAVDKAAVEALVTPEDGSPGIKPRDAVRQVIEAQYRNKPGEGVKGLTPRTEPAATPATPTERIAGVNDALAEGDARLAAQNAAEGVPNTKSGPENQVPTSNARPPIPREARQWSFAKQKRWAKENGYNVSGVESEPSLRRRINQQRADALIPELPRPPKAARKWTFKQYKYWAEQSGYSTEGVTGTLSLKKAIKTQRSDGVALARSAAKAAATPPPATPVSTTPPVSGAGKSAPVEYAGKQDRGPNLSPLHLWNLTEDIPGHPKGSTVTTRTLQSEGFLPPEPPTSVVPKEVSTPAEAGKLAVASAKQATPIGGTVAKKSLVAKTIDSILAPVNSRVRDISTKVFDRLMRMEFQTGLARENEKKILVPKMEKMQSALSKSGNTDAFKAAVLNGDFEAARKMVDPEDFQYVVDVLDRLHAAQIAAGVKVPRLDNYWPRQVSDYAAFDAAFGSDQGRFQEAWDQVAKATGRSELTPSEKAEVANSVLQGYGPRKPGAFGPAHARTRSLETLTPEQVIHYADPFSSLMRYVDSASYAAERTRFLGRNATPDNLLESVGQIVQAEVDSGGLDKAQQAELTSLLHTRFTADMLTVGPAVRAFKQATYILTLGQVRNAINQATDLAMTASSYGINNAVKGTARALGITQQERRLMMEDIGIHEYGEEFRDTSKLGVAVNKVLAATGFQRLDRLGKEGRINSAYDAMSAAAKAPQSGAFARLQREYEPVLGDRFNQTMEDLRAGVKSEDVRYLMFLEVAKAQPITLSNMPEQYLKMRNGRVLYTLKSFTVQQIDLVRRDIFRRLATKGERREGLRRLSTLIALTGVLGLSKAAVEDIFAGREVDPDKIDDTIANSILSLVGMSKFFLENFSKKPVSATVNYLVPPVGWMDKIYQDATGQSDKGSKSIKMVPLVGDLLYYHSPLGAGAELDREKQVKDYRAKLKDLQRQAYDAAQQGDADGAEALVQIYNDRRRQGGGDGRNSPLRMSDLRKPPAGSPEAKARLDEKKKKEAEKKGAP